MYNEHAPGEYYHIYNRGTQKQPIFENNTDKFRLLFLLLTFQGDISIKNISREVKQSVQSQTLHIKEDMEGDILKSRTVELVAFCFMPNHFHLIVREIEEGGIAKYMQRVLTAYAKYFNTKYEMSGHLFQGTYKSVLIGSDLQLMHLSAYIHKNPSELKEWKGKEDKYPWSSYGDYVSKNRFGPLLITDIIMDRYKKDEQSYKKFVKTSLAKEELI